MNFLEHVEGYFAAKFNLVKEILQLFRLEAKLAGHNVFPFLIGAGFLLILGITLWPLLMVFIGYLLFLMTDSPLAAMVSILLLNMLILFYLIHNLKRRMKQMSFVQTRACLAEPPFKDRDESANENALELN